MLQRRVGVVQLRLDLVRVDAVRRLAAGLLLLLAPVAEDLADVARHLARVGVGGERDAGDLLDGADEVLDGLRRGAVLLVQLAVDLLAAGQLVAEVAVLITGAADAGLARGLLDLWCLLGRLLEDRHRVGGDLHERLGASPHRAVVVGDAQHDAQHCTGRLTDCVLELLLLDLLSLVAEVEQILLGERGAHDILLLVVSLMECRHTAVVPTENDV